MQCFRRGLESFLGKRIVLWCNGSTAVFGSACLGSNPGKTTQKKSFGFLPKLFFVFSPCSNYPIRAVVIAYFPQIMRTPSRLIKIHPLQKYVARRGNILSLRLGRAMARPQRRRHSDKENATGTAWAMPGASPRELSLPCTDMPSACWIGRAPRRDTSECRATTKRDVKISPNVLCMRNVPKARPYMVADVFARFHLPTY